MEHLKIKVWDHGDPSVGILPVVWELDCPFSEIDDPELLESFRKEVIKLYSDFVDGKMEVFYDFELNT